MTATGLTIRELCRRSHENSKAKGFWDGQLDPADMKFIPEKLMLIVSEASEALESYRKGEPLNFYSCKECLGVHGAIDGQNPTCSHHPQRKVEGVSSELADVMIRVADLAERLGIDLERAVEEKHAYNLTRPARHGGKAC